MIALLRLTDARTGSKVDLQPRSMPWRIAVGTEGQALPLGRRAAVTADLVAAALSLVEAQALPADSQHEPTIWIGAGPGPDGALWVRPGPVVGEFGGIDDLSWRVLCLQHRYHAPLEVDGAARGRARTAILRLQRAQRNLVREAPGGAPDPRASVQGQRFEGQLHAALLDDLATPEAMAILWQILDHDIEAGEQLRLLLEATRLLGLRETQRR